MPAPLSVLDAARVAVRKKRPPLQAEDDTATGIGGMARRRKIDEYVDEATTGRKKRGQTTDAGNGY